MGSGRGLRPSEGGCPSVSGLGANAVCSHTQVLIQDAVSAGRAASGRRRTLRAGPALQIL